VEVLLMLDAFLTHTLNGLYYGFILFMIASGLTIIFGVLGVLNLAHGEFYALGAYFAFSVVGYVTGVVSVPGGVTGTVLFVLLVLAGSLVAAALLVPVGAFIETTVIRPIYDRDEVYQLLLTYAVLLITTDVIKLGYGSAPRRLEGVYGNLNELPTTELLGFGYPSYNVIVMITGTAVFAGLLYFFNRTKTGRIIRATAIDREMATAIGVSTDRTFTLVFALGALFAGFGGAIALPPIATQLEMGVDPLILSFVVIVIGGLGSLKGAFVGSLLVGVTSSWATWQYPPAELAAPFVLMAVILLVKPEGLFGTWGEIE
jgi:branched-chain amino acid transport system permease protein